MRGSYMAFVRQASREAYELHKLNERNAALAEEAAELKRARIMNRAEPGYERKDGKL